MPWYTYIDDALMCFTLGLFRGITAALVKRRFKKSHEPTVQECIDRLDALKTRLQADNWADPIGKRSVIT